MQRFHRNQSPAPQENPSVRFRVPRSSNMMEMPTSLTPWHLPCYYENEIKRPATFHCQFPRLPTAKMSLTLQLEDLGRAHVYADLDNHISLSMKTSPDTDLPPMPSGILIHFEIVTSENGQRKFHVYTSSTLSTPQPNNYTTPMSVDPEAMQNTLDLSFMSGFPMGQSYFLAYSHNNS